MLSDYLNTVSSSKREALFISKLSRPMLKAASGISCEGRCLTLKMTQPEISMIQQSATYKQRLVSWMRASKSTFMYQKGETSLFSPRKKQ